MLDRRRPRTDARLAATLPGAAFGAGTPPPTPERGDAPALDRPAVPCPGTPAGARYALDAELGSGAGGRVYALIDRNLDRPVAVKVLATRARTPDDVVRFVEEARITAALEHPNVLPVHELDVDARGDVYFTMKKIDGRSLAEAIEASACDARAAEIRDAAAVVAIFVGVCQALAYAHHRGVVHQDVKPANVMLGGFGEVLLVDWGSAARLVGGTTTRLYGTPLYMSPEQARGEPIDARADVYALGATLFHALTLRPPTWHDDADAFWRMKRAGEIAPPDAAERARAPAALFDVALKAMAPQPAHRYADAEAMLADLRAYQAGMAVSAHRESVVARLRRWHRRHARAIWTTAAFAAVVIAATAAVWGERIKEIATWGTPIVAEDFTGDWQSHWRLWDGAFVPRDGAVTSIGDLPSAMFLDRRLSGEIAIECDATAEPGTRPGDLSFVWAREVEVQPDGRVRPQHPIYLQFGAHDGGEALINHEGHRMAYRAQREEVGRTYRIRAEIVGDRLALLVDGRRVCEWVSPTRFDGGYVGIFAYYPGKRFARVRVSTRMAERVPATAIGDFLAAGGDDEHAVAQYAGLIDGHLGSGIEDEARFKAGRCCLRLGRREEAERFWSTLGGTRFAPLIALERCDERAAAGDHAAAIAGLEAAIAQHPGISGDAAMRWTWYIAHAPYERLDAYLALRDRRFADLTSTDAAAAGALLALGRRTDVLRRFPGQREMCAVALIALGEFERVLREYRDQEAQYDEARLNLGLGDIDHRSNPWCCGLDLIWRGRAEEAIARCDDPDVVGSALASLGRLDEFERNAARFPRSLVMVRSRALRGLAPTEEPAPADARALALLVAGDASGAAAIGVGHRYGGWAECVLGIDAAAAGDRDGARAHFARGRGALEFDLQSWSLPRLVEPFVAGAAGDWSAFDAACAALARDGRSFGGQKPWFAARWLTGAIDDDAFRAQPLRLFADADLLLLEAMRAERAGDAAGARAAYAAWLVLPAWRRSFDVPVPWERLARWRLSVLR